MLTIRKVLQVVFGGIFILEVFYIAVYPNHALAMFSHVWQLGETYGNMLLNVQ